MPNRYLRNDLVNGLLCGKHPANSCRKSMSLNLCSPRSSPCIVFPYSAVSHCIFYGSTSYSLSKALLLKTNKPQRKLVSGEGRDFHLWVCSINSFSQTLIEHLPHTSPVLGTQSWLRYSFWFLGTLNLIRWNKMFHSFALLSHFFHP